MIVTRIKHYPWLSLVTLGAFILLCGLSLWQVERLYWKRDLIRTIETTRAAPPIHIRTLNQLSKVTEFRRVVLHGTLLNDDSFHLQARYYKGNLGFNLITPMRLTDGALLFLNRGWVPKDYKTNPKVKITTPEGRIKVTGIIRSNDRPRSYLPQNDPEKGLWLWQDTLEWSSILRRKHPTSTLILPILVQQTHEGNRDDGFPIPQDAQFKLRNDHLEYALTWGSFALILLVIYVIYTRK